MGRLFPRAGWRHVPADVRDNEGVDRLASAMRGKLAAKRAEGYGGWDDPQQCSVHHLARLLVEHLPKGDPVDVANFAMMLFNREGGAQALKLECGLRRFEAQFGQIPAPEPWPAATRKVVRGVPDWLVIAIIAGCCVGALAAGATAGALLQ